jgi:protoporphyrinogen/coproporphyrinogen III oxidase
LESEVVYNSAGISFLYTDGELKPIPLDSVFGIPASLESLAKSTLISAEGKVAALKDFYTKNERFTKSDSIGEFLEYFLGKELVEKQIAPVLSGVYSGNLRNLTIESTLPYLLDYKEQYGSIIKGLAVHKEKFKASGEKKFISFKNGLGSLVDAYEQKLENVEIRKGVKVDRIEKVHNGYKVTLKDTGSLDADYVVLSIPHDTARRLVDDKELEQEFRAFQNSSMISVYAGFDIPDHLLPLDGTGFIKANGQEIICDACTWTSRKWQHTSESGNLLVRLFYKSTNPAFSRLKEMTETELLQAALSDLSKSLDISAIPVVSVVTNWSDCMPIYQLDHSESVQSLENKLAERVPGIVISGCSYFGVGIPDCIENGKNTARKIISLL